ncbi:hypothetical protein [Streptomyces sp. NRRL S-350]|uniref:hypothetical protein n=1 Tax=Streptomyces sp. NRRL S-350 TaxID=1463902 RepID=UPI0004C040D3|nr:hypothetical protein [Streptomyces sp. NRRL S-350]
MADTDDKQAGAQAWGAAAVVASALAVVAAYLINGAALVLAVAGVETVLLMVYVGRRWRALHGRPPLVRRRPRRGIPDAAHCERCRRAREALDARQARGRSARPVWPTPWAEFSAHDEHRAHDEYLTRDGQRAHDGQRARHEHEGPEGAVPQSESGAADHAAYSRRPQGRGSYERPWTAERATTRSVDRAVARRGAPGSAGRAVRHQ